MRKISKASFPSSLFPTEVMVILVINDAKDRRPIICNLTPINCVNIRKAQQVSKKWC